MKTHDLRSAVGIPEPSQDHPSDYALLKYVRDELVGDKEQQFISHISSCAACQKRVEDIPAHRSAFLADHPFEDSINGEGSKRPRVRMDTGRERLRPPNNPLPLGEGKPGPARAWQGEGREFFAPGAETQAT